MGGRDARGDPNPNPSPNPSPNPNPNPNPTPIPNKERLEALLVAAYDEIRADLSGDAARRGKLEAHCERLELESRMAWQHLRRIAGSHPG